MKAHIDLSFTAQSTGDLQEVLEALLRHLQLRAVKTDETQQGRRHGVVSVEVESVDAPWGDDEGDQDD